MTPLETTKQEVLTALGHLTPIKQEKWDDSWSIYSEKFSVPSPTPIGQLTLASLLRPVEQGPHKKKLHIFYTELVEEMSDGSYEVCFLFKWS